MPDDLYDPTYDNIVVPADAPTVEDILVVLAAKQIIADYRIHPAHLQLDAGAIPLHLLNKEN